MVSLQKKINKKRTPTLTEKLPEDLLIPLSRTQLIPRHIPPTRQMSATLSSSLTTTTTLHAIDNFPSVPLHPRTLPLIFAGFLDAIVVDHNRNLVEAEVGVKRQFLPIVFLRTALIGFDVRERPAAVQDIVGKLAGDARRTVEHHAVVADLLFDVVFVDDVL